MHRYVTLRQEYPRLAPPHALKLHELYIIHHQDSIHCGSTVFSTCTPLVEYRVSSGLSQVVLPLHELVWHRRNAGRRLMHAGTVHRSADMRREGVLSRRSRSFEADTYRIWTHYVQYVYCQVSDHLFLMKEPEAERQQPVVVRGE